MTTKNVTRAGQRASRGIPPGTAEVGFGAEQESRMHVWPAFARGPTALASDRQTPARSEGCPAEECRFGTAQGPLRLTDKPSK